MGNLGQLEAHEASENLGPSQDEGVVGGRFVGHKKKAGDIGLCRKGNQTKETMVQKLYDNLSANWVPDAGTDAKINL